MREYIDTKTNRLSFIIDEDPDKVESFYVSKCIIEKKLPQLQVLDYSASFWESGHFKFVVDTIEIELFFTSYFGGTEILIDNAYTQEIKHKIRMLALEIYNVVHTNKSE